VASGSARPAEAGLGAGSREAAPRLGFSTAEEEFRPLRR
jgi:hypothetical protein